MHNYKDTVLWKIVCNEQPELVDLLDSIEEKRVSKTRTGLCFNVADGLNIHTVFDIETGLKVLQEAGEVLSDLSLPEIKTRVEADRLAKAKELTDKQIIARVRSTIADLGFTSGSLYLENLGLYLKVFANSKVVSVEIGYEDDYQGFVGIHSVEAPTAQLLSMQDYRRACKQVLLGVIDNVKAETSQFE